MKLLILPGSARHGSFNAKLAAVAAEHARQSGVEVDLVAADDLRLPIYDGDLEEAEGLPTSAKALKKRFLEAQAIIFACPEYNSSITPLLKNVIDWVSRTESDDEPGLAAYRGKVAGLISASPGALGGLRGLVTVRSILSNIGVLVVPNQTAIGKAYEAFDEHGKLKDAGQHQAVASVVDVVIKTTKALETGH